MYIEPATKLYTLADLSRVWVNAQVFQNDVGRLKRGDSSSITVDAYPGRTFKGRVEEILPQVDMTTRTVKVRLAVNNPGVTLKPGMFVNVDLKSALGRQLVVPASAVFQTGLRQVVFVDHGNGSLEPKDVSLGARVGDDFIVLKGLQPISRLSPPQISCSIPKASYRLRRVRTLRLLLEPGNKHRSAEPQIRGSDRFHNRP